MFLHAYIVSITSIIFGKICFISGLEVNSVSLCEVVCQEEETYEPNVWLVLFCSEFHSSLHIAFLTFLVLMVSIHYHITLYCFMGFLGEACFWQNVFFLLKNCICWLIVVSIITNQLKLIGKLNLIFLDLLTEQVLNRSWQNYNFCL